MMDDVKISIITATYNRAHVLRDTLESLESQTWRNFEHIVQDGGSTDGTLALLEAFEAPYRKVVSESDNGIYDALNKAMRHATGDVIGILHSDDYYPSPHVLEKVAEAFRKGADAAYGDLIYVSRDRGRVVRYWRAGAYSPNALKLGWMPPHPAFFIKREVVLRHGGYDTAFRIAADYDAMLRWLIRGRLNPHYIPEVLMAMRIGGASNASLKNIVRKSLEDYRAMKRNRVGGLATLFMKNATKLRQFLHSGSRVA